MVHTIILINIIHITNQQFFAIPRNQLLTHLGRITRRDTNSINDAAEIFERELSDILIDVSLYAILELGRLDGAVAIDVPKVEQAVGRIPLVLGGNGQDAGSAPLDASALLAAQHARHDFLFFNIGGRRRRIIVGVAVTTSKAASN